MVLLHNIDMLLCYTFTYLFYSKRNVFRRPGLASLSKIRAAFGISVLHAFSELQGLNKNETGRC